MERNLPLLPGSGYPVILSGKLVSKKGVCFPETSQNAILCLASGGGASLPPFQLGGGHTPTSLCPSFIITDSGLGKKDTAASQTVSYTEKTKTGI